MPKTAAAAGLGKRFPKRITLKDRGKAEIRPLRSSDAKKLLEFFRRLPEDDRLYLKDDVTKKTVIDRWCKKIDLGTILPLVAVQKDRIVGDATLHRNSGGWTRHVGKVRVVVDPEHRRGGLATALVRELIGTARTLGLSFLDAEFMTQQEGAMHLFEGLGFKMIAELADHVRDISGEEHDFRIYTLDLTE